MRNGERAKRALKKTGYRFGSNQMNALHLIVLKCFVLQNTETEVLVLGLSPDFLKKYTYDMICKLDGPCISSIME